MTRAIYKHLPTGAHVFPEGYAKKDLALLSKVDMQEHDDETALCELRQQRNAHLAASDSMMLPDRGLTPEQVEQWVKYRQVLRDITKSDVSNPAWPDKPERK